MTAPPERPATATDSGEVEGRRVLLADDQPHIRVALELLLKGEGFVTETAASVAEALAAVKLRSFDAVLADLNYSRDTTSGEEGLELVAELQRIDPQLPVVVMTAWGTIPLAVEAMRRGARDFVLKPWDNAQLADIIRRNARKSDAGSGRNKDMEIAARVQRSLFPQLQPPLATLDYTGRCLEAGAVGGDYYDFIDLGDGQVAFVLADASGKGISAALLMANLQASLRTRCANSSGDLAGMLIEVNRLFYASTSPEHYATLFFGVYDDTSRRLSYVNCGHLPPMVLRTNGPVERLAPTAPAIGLLEEWTASVASVKVATRDTLVMFSDGITEAEDGAGTPFGDDRLSSVVRNCGAIGVVDTVDRVVAAVRSHAGALSVDDLTIVVARGRG